MSESAEEQKARKAQRKADEKAQRRAEKAAQVCCCDCVQGRIKSHPSLHCHVVFFFVSVST
jgi:hypothetical protein